MGKGENRVMEKTTKWLKDNILGIILSLISYIVAAVGAVLASLKHVPMYIILSLGAVFLAIAIPMTVLIINQIALWKERHKKRLSKYSEKEIEDTIREWVDTPFLTFKREEIPNVHFQFTVSSHGVPVSLIRNHKETHAIGIVTDVSLIPTDGKQEMPVTEDLWREVNGNVSIELARLGIQFEFNGKKNLTERVRLIEPVFIDDSLTRLRFLERVMFVMRAVILVQEVAKQIFREYALTSRKEGSQK